MAKGALGVIPSGVAPQRHGVEESLSFAIPDATGRRDSSTSSPAAAGDFARNDKRRSGFDHLTLNSRMLESTVLKEARGNIFADKWLGEMLGRSAYRVAIDAELVHGKARGRPEHARLRRILRTTPVFVYSRVRTGDLEAVGFLQDLGFRLIDANLVFEKPIERSCSVIGNCTVRFAESTDEPQAVALARRAFRFSRFHLDPAIGRETANRLKAEWVRNFFRGKRGDAMVVALAGKKVVGFLQLLRGSGGALVIDLIAVDARRRGHGIAGAMISFAERHCKGAKRIRAGTQVANVPSIRMYEKLGFKVADAGYVFHYHCSM